MLARGESILLNVSNEEFDAERSAKENTSTMIICLGDTKEMV